jgi:hypothetical protein
MLNEHRKRIFDAVIGKINGCAEVFIDAMDCQKNISADITRQRIQKETRILYKITLNHFLK